MATANLNEPTSAVNGNIPFIGSASDDGTGNTLRDAITRINDRLKEIYGSQDGSNVVQTPFIDQDNIKADAIGHDELANRYTARASAVTTSGPTTLDWSSAAIFPVTMGGSHTLNFSNYKKGQVVDIIVSGAYTITLGTSSGTPAINQVGSGTYDNTTTNLIQITCTDDDATPEFFYSVGTYSADTDPA